MARGFALPGYGQRSIVLQNDGVDVFDSLHALLADGGANFLLRYTFLAHLTVQELTLLEQNGGIAVDDAFERAGMCGDLGQHYLNYNQNAKREAWDDLKKVLHFVYD